MFVAIRDNQKCRVGDAESLELAHHVVARLMSVNVRTAKAAFSDVMELESELRPRGVDVPELLLGTWTLWGQIVEAWDWEPEDGRTEGAWYRKYGEWERIEFPVDF